MSVEKLIKNAGRLVVGRDEVLKKLKAGELSEVFVAQNCPETIFAELENAARLSGISVGRLGINADELGVKLKKQHATTILGLSK